MTACLLLSYAPLLHEGTDTTVAQLGRQIFVTDWLCGLANYTRAGHTPFSVPLAHNFSHAFAQRGSPCRRARNAINSESVIGGDLCLKTRSAPYSIASPGR